MNTEASTSDRLSPQAAGRSGLSIPGGSSPLRESYLFREPITVRWADIDSMGHVNNAKYFTYCESARMSFFAAVEIERHRAAKTHGPVLASATLDFRRQVHYPAKLEVGLKVIKVGNRSFILEYGVFRHSEGGWEDRPVADGTSAVVWMDYSIGRAIPVSPALREALSVWCPSKEGK